MEDYPPDVYWLRRILGEAGRPYSLRVFPTAESALAHVKDWGRPHLLLIDWFLPIMDADEFLKQVKSIRGLAALPVSVFTSEPELQRTALGLGAIGCLTKPVDVSQLENLFSRLPLRKAASAAIRGPRAVRAMAIKG